MGKNAFFVDLLLALEALAFSPSTQRKEEKDYRPTAATLITLETGVAPAGCFLSIARGGLNELLFESIISKMYHIPIFAFM